MKAVRSGLHSITVQTELAAKRFRFAHSASPAVSDARHNPHAFELLQRDIQRVADYFTRYGVVADAQALALELWQPYMGRDY